MKKNAKKKKKYSMGKKLQNKLSVEEMNIVSSK